MRFNKALKELRKERQLNQEQFAKLLGVTQTYISNVENEKINISFEALKKHYKKFGKKIEIKL